MLDSMRRGASTWIAKLLLALLIVSFGIFWGVSDVFRGFGGNTVASVGSQKVTTTAFDQAYRRELDTIGRRRGKPMTRDEANRAGLPALLISQMVTDAAILDAARRLGVGVSDIELVRQIQADPTFQAGGQFSRGRFSQILQSNGWSEDQYIALARDSAIRSQLIEAVAGPMPAPKMLLEAANAYRNEERVVSYLQLTPAIVGDIADPAPDVLKSYFEERKVQFRAPEYRKVVALAIDPETIARPGDVTDDDAKAAYQRNLSRFGDPEKRRVQQIAFDKPEEAEAAAALLKSGKSFDDLLAERAIKAEDADLGLLSKAGFLDPAVGDAAFGLAKDGDVTGVVKGRFRTVMLRLMEIKPAGQKPFEEVKTQLKSELARERAVNEIMSRHDQIEDARAGGAHLDEVAKRFDLKSVSVEFDRTGRAPDGSSPTGLPEAAKLIPAAFESDVGVENDTIPHGANGFVWFEVTAITPARDRPLEEVTAEATARWKADQLRARLAAKAVELTARIEKGEPIEEVAKSAGLEVKTSPALKRGEPAEGLGAGVVSAAFSGPEGTATTALGEDGSRFVIRVKEVNEAVFFGDTDTSRALDKQIATDIQNTLQEQYVRQLRNDVGFSVNQQVLSRLVGNSPNP
ncbi:peptidylprolyl isomerase [Prosthecomicrobium hirschii]|uniref:peptidylprolyl isomerase n=1 Tax=Prosthecodimorpha hirschii TaxID=665126 RepID=UPI00112C899E|nr:peptidylprolyl isomerase [Prosthecomicrobium hirschii]TPQ50848.1 peptidylprolyl isomerase [Prosthecomicrobium hirschii]